jgi:hypothetical protein
VSALRATYDELLVRRRAADDAGAWHEAAVLGDLADIADYVARIGDVADSAHYRADKAGPLLDAAIRLQEDVFLAVAAWPAEDTPLARAVAEATMALDDAATAVRRALWDLMHSAHYADEPAVYRSTSRRLAAAAGELSRWATALAAGAVPDPQEGSW